MNSSLSAIIPVYNGERFIRDAVNSILSQTYAVDEIVIIDDGSKDNSAIIAEEMSKNASIPIRVFRQENAGVSAARNLGLIKSSGKLIAFLDVDDIWFESKIKTQVAVYERLNDENLFVFTDYYSDEEREEARKFFTTKGYNVCLGDNYSRKDFQLAFVQQNFVGTASTIVFNRELALKIGGFNAKLNHSEDFDFILRYSQHARMVAVDTPMVMKRHHGENLTGNNKLHYWSHNNVLESSFKVNPNYCRYNFDSDVLDAMKLSYDQYTIRYCNELYEDSSWLGIKYYVKNFPTIKTFSGLKEYSMAFFRKLIRLLSFNKIKR